MRKDQYNYQENLEKLSDEDLIGTFNRQVGVQAWGNARAEYLHAMRNEFLRRDFDSSLIITEHTLCLAKKIKVENAKVVFIEIEIQ